MAVSADGLANGGVCRGLRWRCAALSVACHAVTLDRELEAGQLGAASGGAHVDGDDRRADSGVATVLLVDDVQFARAAVSGVIAAMAEFEVIAEANGGAVSVEVARTLRPQVAVVDVHMPDIDGFETCRRLLACDPGMLVVLTSADDERGLVDECGRCGAIGFLRKDDFSGTALRHLLLPRLRVLQSPPDGGRDQREGAVPTSTGVHTRRTDAC
jgi:CheY-like chemotaxis protein